MQAGIWICHGEMNNPIFISLERFAGIDAPHAAGAVLVHLLEFFALLALILLIGVVKALQEVGLLPGS